MPRRKEGRIANRSRLEGFGILGVLSVRRKKKFANFRGNGSRCQYRTRIGRSTRRLGQNQ